MYVGYCKHMYLIFWFTEQLLLDGYLVQAFTIIVRMNFLSSIANKLSDTFNLSSNFSVVEVSRNVISQ